ncbi:hypothetical protein BUALT_Bualt11G0055300 [Buddleja alternifolia]|uniref:Uncharacterized protein n=1 Tax=Buddleja alternifolia TaxID=168488 RepID=A0AAV6WXK5_9LAMI|nr:hypothetical protein BUALT_Bualt11G0055300 [Buddleja alternifolia]
MGRLVCPKPCRVGQSHFNNCMMPLRFHTRAELLGMILSKDGSEAEPYETISSSPPPFCFRSPPCRNSNPLIQDVHFGVEKLNAISSSPSDSASPPSTHPSVNIGMKQSAVIRVEGFGCQSSRLVAMG